MPIALRLERNVLTRQAKNRPAEVGTRPPCSGPPTPSNSPRIPFLENPTTCGEPLTSSLEILAYDSGTSIAESPYPATTGCDQLSFNPSLYAQPTTTATDTPSGLEVDLSVPQQQSPDSPLSLRDPRRHRQPARGLLDQPQRRRRQDRLHRRRSALRHRRKKPSAPNPPRSAASRSTAPPSPAPFPASSTWANRSPATATASSSSPTASPPTSSWPASVTPNPRPASSPSPSPNLPQSPFTDFNMHFFGSERGLLATPTQCGTYPVDKHLHPLGCRPARTRPPPSSSPSTPGLAAPPAPAPAVPSTPAFRRSSADNTAGAHSPFSLELTRTDGDQNLSALTVTTPPGFSATLKGIPYCSDAALDAGRRTQLLGPRRGGQPELPAPPRSAPPTPAPAPATIPSTSPARSTSPAPTRARRSQPRRDHPGGLRPL